MAAVILTGDLSDFRAAVSNELGLWENAFLRRKALIFADSPLLLEINSSVCQE